MEPPQSGSASVFLSLGAVLALVLANAFFVAAEFALVGARLTRLEEMGRAGDRKAMLAVRAVQSLDRYISATQLGITLASLGLGWIGEPALARLIEGGFTGLPEAVRGLATHSVAVVIAFSIITVLHIVLGELAPKAVALLYPEKVSGWVVAPLMGFNWVMAGPIKLLNGTANAVLRLFRIKTPSGHERVHSPDEIRMLVEQSQEFGTLGAQDARLLEGVFEFSEKSAEEVMTPRTEVVAIDGEEAFILHPGEFVLGQTLEWVELPDDVVARLEGRSSLGRLGLLIHSTAGYVDPGWKGNLTLELSNVANLPIALYAGMGIGQISFFSMSSPVERPYGSTGLGSKYQGQTTPTASESFRDFASARRTRKGGPKRTAG